MPFGSHKISVGAVELHTSINNYSSLLSERIIKKMSNKKKKKMRRKKVVEVSCN